MESIPRAYGGVSDSDGISPIVIEYSPCIRGCFPVTIVGWSYGGVFPVHTGVFLGLLASIMTIKGIPRAYGGVSISE